MLSFCQRKHLFSVCAHFALLQRARSMLRLGCRLLAEVRLGVPVHACKNMSGTPHPTMPLRHVTMKCNPSNPNMWVLGAQA